MTIYDIASLAQVSPSTVSRVLNNKGNVSIKTKKKVQKILKENNFVVNEAARGLVMKQTKMIGILIADLRTIQHTNSIYYIEQELAKQGYICFIMNTGTSEEGQANGIYTLSQRNVDAAILIGSIYQNEGIKKAIETYLSSTPIFFFNGSIDLPNVYSLLADEKAGVREAVFKLRNSGRKRIAFVVDNNTPSNLSKIDGYKEAIPNEPIVVHTDGSLLGGFEATMRLLSSYKAVDAIVYSEDLLAVCGLNAIIKMGLFVPDDIAIVGINNSIFSETSNPPLTSIDNMLQVLSIMTAKNLENILSGQDVEKKIVIGTNLIERKST